MESVYQPSPAWSGREVALPVPPTLPTTPIKIGDAFTVYGAIHTLHDPFHQADLQSAITIVGVVVETNFAHAPKCALHHTGQGDPDGRVTDIPSFTIADEGDPTVTIRVMGFASNFANLYEAYLKYGKLSAPPYKLVDDELWAVPIPFPLPVAHSKVRVTGRYSGAFSRSSGGIVSDMHHGIVTLSALQTLERPAHPTPIFPQLTH